MANLATGIATMKETMKLISIYRALTKNASKIKMSEVEMDII